MAKKPVVKKSIKFTPPVRNDEEVLKEIQAVREVIEVKTNQTTDTVSNEQLEELKNDQPPVTNGGETKTETTETISTHSEPKKGMSIMSDSADSITQEDLDRKEKEQTIQQNETTETTQTTNIEQRLEDSKTDDFVTNEGATEEEDTPEYRREMAKIKASALVEFFDVIFMVICCTISKDFSDNSQTKFSLVKERKNAIKANVFQILAFSKKKHNPTGTVIFLILFSYVPLIILAVMQRVKAKKEEQEIQIQETKHQLQFIPPPPNYVNQFPNEYQKPVRKSNKIIQVHEQSGAKVTKLKDGSFKNTETGQIYKGGRGRKPEWVKRYIGKIG